MTAITRIYRIGHPRQHRVALECGHKFTVADEDMKRRQLYIGKRVTCPECGKESNS